MCKANFWRRPDRRRGVSFLRHHLLVLLNTVHKYGGMDTQLNTRKTCMTCTGLEQSFLRVSASSYVPIVTKASGWYYPPSQLAASPLHICA